ncbi:hypothetical protein RB653_000234 [Dictyostelium firmibasis]|uniref:NmrA-like domain-containing protein n=1 Tax=Dictyostelium firmibasis TaxID=79012 RepID=A0AAN7Z111_9MYCE
MKKIIFFFVIINILILIVNSQDFKLGGSCEVIDSKSPCFSYLNYTNFYLQPGDSIIQLNQNVSDILGKLEFTTPDCKSNATYLFCLKSYPKCESNNETLSNGTMILFNLPSLPCNSICLKAEIPCKVYIDNYFKDLSCISKYSNGDPMFPINSTEYEFSERGIYDFKFNVQCSNDIIYDNKTTKINCPAPLLNAEDNVIPGKTIYYYITDNCILDCPFEIYPTKTNILNKTNYVLTSISFITCVFMVITFGILPNKLSHRMESILSFACGGCITALSVFIQSRQDNFNCSSDPGRFKSQSDYLCLLTGLIFQFGGITSIFWSPMIAYDFFMISRLSKIRKFGYYRIGIWSLIFVLTALPAFGGKYSATVTTNCWINSDDGSAWQYVSFYIPSWTAMGILCILSVLSVINVSKMYRESPNRRILFFNIKIIITSIILLFNLTFASSLKFYLEDKMDTYFDAIAIWADCISQGDPSKCELKAPGYELKAMNVVVVSILGFCIFIGYGLDPIVIQIWKESNKLKWIVNKCGLDDFIKLGSETSTTSTGSGSGNEKKQSKGGSVVKELLKDELFKVITLSRNPESEKSKELIKLGAQVIKCDESQPKEEIEKVMKGCDYVYLVTNSQGYCDKEIEYGKKIVDAALKSGVKHIIFSTVPGPCKLSNGKFKSPDLDNKAEIEDYIKQLSKSNSSFISSFVIAPWYYQNFVNYYKPEKDENGKYVLKWACNPKISLDYGDIDEIGLLVREIFKNSTKYSGETIPFSSQILTPIQIVEIMSKVTNKNVSYQFVNPSEFGKLDPEVSLMLDFFNEYGGFNSYLGDRSIAHNIKKLTTFEEYLKNINYKLE